MANYGDAQQLLQQLKPIINQCIENHPLVESAIKAKKGVVQSVDTAKGVATLMFPFDKTPITLPYSTALASYIAEGKVVSVWYYGKNVNNGIIAKSGDWLEG